ncbi:cation transporter [Spongiactinospora gelatinilytica]|uniref:Cation transporter n=1 Tax=Spongiactinospora gelatinilytica TaxID=2666298 RepID=A0A2W2FWY0_9ACTN|nr:cation diffusion facilitator family transporter [Spongiactinospora gelatinilytica]PZG32945.1 cation transporter [Spongiactinospora gelatinilytica]
MSASGGTKAIVAALIANLSIAVAKFVAYLFTLSSSMLAESIHSVADSGNQVLLLVGGKRAQRARTPKHPFGYGRERYFYAFVVAVVLFTVGAVFSIYEGVHKISDPHPVKTPVVAFGVLIFAIIAETFSFRTAIREANQVRNGQSWVQFIRRSKAPELPVIVLEDLGALVGLILALLGVAMAVITGNGVWDGVGTIAIGVLLAVIAVILAVETKSLLIGEGAGEETEDQIVAALTGGPEVSRVIHLRTLHIGPEELLVAAKIAIDHDDTAAEVARGIDAAEQRVRAAVPIARVIYLEPDLYQSQRADPATTAPAPGAG